MPTDIGPRIGLQGEKEFQNSIRAIGAQLKSLGNEMKAVTAEFSGNESSMEALSSKADVLRRSIEANANQMKTLTAQYNRQVFELENLEDQLTRVTQQFGANSKEAAAAQNAYNKQAAAVSRLESDINRSRTTMAQYKNQLDQVEAQMNGTADGADELGDSMTDAGNAADKSGRLFDAATVAIGNLASSAIEAAVSAIGDLIGALVNLDESTEEFRVAQGRLNTAFSAAGYGPEAAAQSYRELYGIIGDTDTAAEAAQLLARLSDSEADFAQWTNIAAGVAGTFGDALPINSLIEAANETVKVGEVTGVLADALNWAGINEEDFNAKLAAAGGEAKRNDLVMQTMAGTYDQAAQAFYDINDPIIQARNAEVEMQTATSDLGGTISELRTRLTSDLTPALSTAAGALNGFLSGDLSFGEMLGQLGELGGQMAQSLVSGIAAAVPQMMEAASGLFQSLSAGFSENLPALIDSGLQAISGFSASLRENAGMLVDAAMELAQNLAQGLADSIPTIVEQVPEIVSNIAGIINDNAPKIVETGLNIIVTLVKGMIDAIPVIIENIPQILKAMWDAFVAFNWVGLGKNLVSAIGNGLKGAAGLLKTEASNLGNTIKTEIGKLPGQLLQAGKNIVTGLVNGIKSMGSWLKNQITSFCTGVLDGFLSFFGIQSPSRVMRDQVGVMIARGLALGVEKGQPQVEKAAADISKVLEDEIAKSNETIARMEQEEIQHQADQEQAERERTLREMYQELGQAEWDERQDILDEIAQQQAEWDAEQVEAAREAEREAAEARLEELEDFQKQYQDALEEIQNSQADMASKLRDYGDLFEEADGRLELGSLREQISAIRQYGNALEQLKTRGVSDSLLGEITGMDIEDATAYTRELLSMTDEQYGEYMTLWEQKQAEAQRVAEQFYSSELDALNEEYVQQIPEALSDLKDQLVTIGQDSALGLADGFESMASRIKDAFVGTLQNALQAAKNSMGIHSPSTVWRDEVGGNMALGLADGFVSQMRAVSGAISSAIPTPTVDTVNNAAAGMVNGLAALNQGGGFPKEIVLKLENGKEVARWLLPDIRAVSRADPEVVSGV